MEIEYCGVKYAGWQSQKNAVAIQDIIERKLSAILSEKTKLTSSCRTDSGVHAFGQVANFKTHSNLKCDNIQKAVNSLLPCDICVRKIKEVNLHFNSRFRAKSKIYRYTICNSKIRSAIGREYYWWVPYELNIELMRKELSWLVGRHNFRSFSTSDKKERQMHRRILRTSLSRKGVFLFIDIEGESFLYNMVRNIVGTLVEIGRGRFPKGSMKKILDAKDRKIAGPCAPPRGLFLLKVIL